jgi:hypothetical protein
VLAHLELDDHETPQRVVVEQVQELITADDDRPLASVEGEPGAQFDEESLDVVDQRLFELALAHLFAELEEVEHVRVFGRMQGGAGVLGFQDLVEVRDGCALAFV